MNTLIKTLSKNYGYLVTIKDIIQMYKSGELLLTDKQENEIIKYLDNIN